MIYVAEARRFLYFGSSPEFFVKYVHLFDQIFLHVVFPHQSCYLTDSIYL